MLTSFLNVDQHIAQGANLIFYIPTCITAIIVNIKNKNIKLNVAIPVAITGILGAFIGSKVSINMPINKLKMCFGIFLITIGIYEIYSLKKEYINYKKNK